MTGAGTRPGEAEPGGVGPLATLVATAGAIALWSTYLWWQLIQVRGGASAVCAFGGTGCAEIWDAPFASAVHRLTGVPVAGWGVIWGLAALALPLAVLVAGLRRRPAPALLGGIRLLALAGLVGLAVLLGVSAAAGRFCTSCAVVYVLTAIYALIALRLLPSSPRAPLGRRLALVFLALAVAWGVLLLPGLRTPRAGAGSSAVAQGPSQLESFLASLDPSIAQGVGASLAAFRAAPPLPQQTPRALIGEAGAPVRITEFSDVLCSHCAALHETLDLLRRSAPPGSFSVDSRQFPLDGRCNTRLSPRPGEDVRCTGALARICFEGREGRDEFSTSLFEHQRELTRDGIFELAEPWLDRSALEACVAAPETRTKLEQDLAYAWRYEPDGTPLVLVDGRFASPFGPFLYALVLAGGNADDPAFDVLPLPLSPGRGR